MSAVSQDGVAFTREGVRLGHDSMVGPDAAHARVIQLTDGTYAAYVSGQLALNQ